MRLILMTMLLIGCANDPVDPFAEATAGDEWGVAFEATADAACAGRPAETGEACVVDFEYTSVEGQFVRAACAMTFTSEGRRGCCIDAGYDIEIETADQPTRTRRVFFATCR